MGYVEDDHRLSGGGDGDDGGGMNKNAAGSVPVGVLTIRLSAVTPQHRDELDSMKTRM